MGNTNIGGFRGERLMVRVTTLIENNPDDENQLLHEHGLSLYIEVDDVRILFDTGQSGDFIKNAKVLDKSLDELDYVIISHGHYDHSGGLQKLVNEYKIPNLIIGEEFFRPKYKMIEVGPIKEFKYNGVSFDEDYLANHQIPVIKVKEEIMNLSDQIMLFHHFERTNEFEHKNDQLVVKKESGFIIDKFEEELVLGIVSNQGLIVIVGCSHVGIINILSSISEKTKLPITAVIGGTHLIGASQDRIMRTIHACEHMDLQLVALSHCTGVEGMLKMKDTYKELFVYNKTGTIINL